MSLHTATYGEAVLIRRNPTDFTCGSLDLQAIF